MRLSGKKLLVIIPTTKGVFAFPTIRSAFKQDGFSTVTVIIAGKSTLDSELISALKAEFHDCDIQIATCKNKEVILPGEARNDGVDHAKKTGMRYDYLLFLDDDIVLPEDYSLILTKFLEKNKSAAVMGKVISRPLNYWTKIIDYSNFWWLQMDNSLINRGWLGAGATLMRYRDAVNIRFKISAAINEDVLYFRLLAKKTKRKLSFCADTAAAHNHIRHNFVEAFKYQFNNGRQGVRFRGNGTNVILSLKKVRRNYKMAAHGNNFSVRSNPRLAIGVFFSFAVFQLGIEWGSLQTFFERKKKR